MIRNRRVKCFLFIFFSLVFSVFSYVAYARYGLSDSNKTIFPEGLQIGDTVGLVAFGSIYDNTKIQYAIERMQALGFKVKVNKADDNKYTNYNYSLIASDINEMFADSEVKAIIAMRGDGQEVNENRNIVSLLNYDLIKSNPKIIIGDSYVTHVLLAINAKTGLVTFYGPAADLPWTKYTVGYIKDILFDAKKVTFINPVVENEDDLIHTKHRIVTIQKGVAQGRLFGGSLSLLDSLNSEYRPDFKGAILFVEYTKDIHYKDCVGRLDSILDSLRQSGVLYQIEGFIFGQRIACDIKNTGGSSKLTMQQVLMQKILPLKIPAWYGSMIGCEDDKMLTLPEGVLVEIDAEKGTIEMLESAVKNDYKMLTSVDVRQSKDEL